jgi:hypothetical protein
MELQGGPAPVDRQAAAWRSADVAL